LQTKKQQYCYLYRFLCSFKEKEKSYKKGSFMVARYKRIALALLIGFVLSTCSIHACITTFINDKMNKLMIYNKQDKTWIVMRKNEKRRFGNQHQRAHFALYIQEPKKPVFSRIYTCTQNACSKTGNIQLRFSDIENGSGDAYLFNITSNEPYISMAQKISTCNACKR
jgi:hypothetical protein